MNFLLDTHSFLWFIDNHPRLSPAARLAIEDPSNTIYLSTVSMWEMAIKVSLGKLTLAAPIDIFVPQQIAANSFSILPIMVQHTFRIAALPFHHRDPFDRLLIAQSELEGFPIIGSDSVFDNYGITRVW